MTTIDTAVPISAPALKTLPARPAKAALTLGVRAWALAANVDRAPRRVRLARNRRSGLVAACRKEPPAYAFASD